MNKLVTKINQHPLRSLSIPTVLSGITFATNVAQSFSDGNITTNEMQTLISSASGIETLILGIIMMAIKWFK